jgi:hypothetical protein
MIENIGRVASQLTFSVRRRFGTHEAAAPEASP